MVLFCAPSVVVVNHKPIPISVMLLVAYYIPTSNHLATFANSVHSVHYFDGLSFTFDYILSPKTKIMNIQKIGIAGLFGGITAFFLGWIVYGMLLKGFWAANSLPGVNKEMPDFLWLVIGNLAYGLFYAYVLGGLANISDPMKGAMTAGIVALIMSVSFDCTMYGTTNIMTMTALPVDIITSVVMGAITGAVVTFVWAKGKA